MEEFDFFETASKKSRGEIIDWIHDSHLTVWESLLESVIKKRDVESRNILVAKVLELVGRKIIRKSDVSSKTDVPVTEGHERNTMSESDYRHKEVKILTVTCNEKFLDSVKNTVDSTSAKRKKHEALGRLLVDLHLFCLQVLERIPLLGADLLTGVVSKALEVISRSIVIRQSKPELLREFTALQIRMQAITNLFVKKKFENKEHYSEQFDQLLQRMNPPDNFRNISVIPTLPELISDPKPFLRPNKMIGPYISSEYYLDVHFRLLREDFVRPLRNAVQEFMNNKTEFVGRRKANPALGISVRVYADVTFLQSEINPGSSNENHLFRLPNKLVSKVRWDKSKRLLPGNLVMLSADFCKTAVFAVTQQIPTSHASCYGRKELANGTLRLAIETGKDLVKEGQSYLLFECDASFRTYRHNLGILQTMTFLESDDESQLNFLNKVIIQASSAVGPPAWLKNGVNLRIPVHYENYKCFVRPSTKTRNPVPKALSVSPLHRDTWPSEEIQEKLRLDRDQYEALKTALTSELAVIQGPPGTGKTYVGLQIVKTLLHNKTLKVLPSSPLLVFCHTNQELDQFLELLLQELPSLSVVRVGGQSKSEKLQNYTLSHLRRTMNNRQCVRHGYTSHKKIMKKPTLLEEKNKCLAKVRFETAVLSQPNGIFNFKGIEVGKPLKKVLPGALWEALLTSNWLGLGQHEANYRDSNFNERAIISTFLNVKPCSKIILPRPSGFNSPVKSKRNGELARKEATKKTPHVGETREEEEEDDMLENLVDYVEELLEDKDRLVSEGPWKPSTYVGTSHPVNEGNTSLYLDKCCVQYCWNRIEEIDVEMKNTPGKHKGLKRERIVCSNRAKLISLIFELYKDNRIELPNVDMFFRKMKYGDGYVLVGNQNNVNYHMSVRWAIYFKVVEIARDMTIAYQEELENDQKLYIEEWNKVDECTLSGVNVIGMTTAEAATMHEVRERAKPEVVIALEAAEILESHLVATLTKHCKQLILIGDHLQFRPSANSLQLWDKYGLNISLFERMILNGVPVCNLKTQHRMRSEISNLIQGTIYKELHNHPKVHQYPRVKGITKNMFFINHQESEIRDADQLSMSNYHEADFLIALCGYLLKQGYEHHQITILTTYAGQTSLIYGILPELCHGVRITSVDNFHGEENDIILVSLVRSNFMEEKGCVAIENRICVALSRARLGLYVIGNMGGLVVASRTWGKIQRKLNRNGDIGTTLELVCEQHGKVTEVMNGKDFVPLANRGCEQPCQAKLPCGHACPQKCHVLLYQNHELLRCVEKCSKKCEFGHPCIWPCWWECPLCEITVLKTLPCGHEQTAACFKDVTRLSCKVPVVKTLLCGHEREVECHLDAETIDCEVQVEKKLPCGHFRQLKCFQSVDTALCYVAVEKVLKCGHKATLNCNEPIEKGNCKVEVEMVLPCGHTKLSYCSWTRTTDIVVQKVEDTVGCSHIIARFKSTTPKICTEKCGKTLPCGHVCPLTCHTAPKLVTPNLDPDHVRCICKESCNRTSDLGDAVPCTL